MNFQLPARFPWATPLLISACAASLLSACGGSGGGTSSFAAAEMSLSGTLVDSTTKAGIPDATISVATTTETPAATTKTKSDGTYSLVVDPTLLNLKSNIVVTYSAVGFASCTEIYKVDSTGAKTLDSSTPSCASLTKSAAGQYFPVDGSVVTRLGNGDADGTENSQLSTSLKEPRLSKEIVLVADPSLGSPPDVTKWTTGNFTVNVKFRGLQASKCPDDRVTIYQGKSLSAASFKQVFVYGAGLKDSPSDGALELQSFLASVSGSAAGNMTATSDSIKVLIEAGTTCHRVAGDAADTDDFEILGVSAAFTSKN